MPSCYLFILNCLPIHALPRRGRSRRSTPCLPFPAQSRQAHENRSLPRLPCLIRSLRVISRLAGPAMPFQVRPCRAKSHLACHYEACLTPPNNALPSLLYLSSLNNAMLGPAYPAMPDEPRRACLSRPDPFLRAAPCPTCHSVPRLSLPTPPGRSYRTAPIHSMHCLARPNQTRINRPQPRALDRSGLPSQIPTPQPAWSTSASNCSSLTMRGLNSIRIRSCHSLYSGR